MARRTPEEAAQTRQKLIETGLQLFSCQGVENTTLKQIAQMAGVTHGALYWHFRNRADLLLHIHHCYELPFEAQYLEQRQGVQQDALAALRQYIMGVLSGFERNPAAGAVYRVFYLAATPVADFAEVEPALEDNRALWLEQLRFFLKQARKQKQLRKSCTPSSLAFTLQAALGGLLFEWLVSAGGFDLREEGGTLVDVLLAGLPHK
ncbi:TetR family transcriptional regulator [Marinobacterium marinum]|uniref:TetR family transcriptional regulator n=1 Tax=Marinobacterium marinum TaxID=2756129 RepID=A0A7W2ACY5_9GAMM|nr:TetR family transcriptional regulator [Marinobacterium marinum]MBA4503580.1 TetR family transcriptional regulator [Marinobacterium marinum]